MNKHKKLLIIFASVLALWVTFGHRLAFHNETLYSFDGCPWLDPGATRWGNASAAKIIQNILSDGELPLWNKYSGIGGPLFSDPHNSFFSPFSIILYLFPGTLGWDAVTLLRLFIFIYLSYVLFHFLTQNVIVATSMAILLGFSGHVYYFLNIVHMNSLVFSPLFLYGIINAFRGEKKRSLLSICISVPLMIFGGGFLDVVLVALYGTFVTLAYLIDGFIAKREKLSFSPVSNLIIGAILSALICGVYLIPYFELRGISVPPYSGRSNTVFNDQWYFLGTFFNQIAVTPENSSSYYMGFRQYLHIIALPGFFMAIIFLWKLGKIRPVVIGSLLFFFFYYFKLYDFKFMQFVNETPLLKHVRYEKYQGTFNLAFYLLSAIGLSEVLRTWNLSRFRFFTLICVFVGTLPFIYRIKHELDPLFTFETFTYALMPIVLMLLVYGRHKLSIGESFISRKLILFYSLFILFVIFQIKHDVEIKLTKKRDNFILDPWMGEIASLCKKHNARVFPFIGPGPRELSVHKVYDIRDYSDVHTERYLHFFKNYVENNTGWHYFILSSSNPDKVNLPMAEFLGVRYIVIDRKQLLSLKNQSQNNYEIIKQIDENYILELTNPEPFFSVFDQFEVLAAELIPENLSTNPNSRSEKLFLEESVDLDAQPDIDLNYSISNVIWKNNSISASVTVNKDSILLVRSQYFPGWHCHVNGQNVPILRGQYLFKTIKLKSGTNLVSFNYMPLSLKIGGITSIFGILLTIFIYKKYSKS